MTILTTLLLLVLSSSTIAASNRYYENECSLDLSNHFGPWDYFDPANHQSNAQQSEGRIAIVEGRHLTSSMLQLKHGSTGAKISPDLNYTLAAIPNNPRALNLASLIAIKHTGNNPKFINEVLRYDIDCYFKRALKLNPSRPEVFHIWGLDKYRKKKYAEAIEKFKSAIDLGSTNPELHYNMGLAYFKLKQYPQAVEQAQVAAKGNYPLDGLQNMLREVGAWPAK